MRILRKLTIAEISLVDKPANKHALIKIAKRDQGENDMSLNFGKAAESDWSEALSNYAKRHNLSKSAATLEFATTIEARDIYKRITRTPRAESISKSAAMGNVTIDVLAKSAFPDDPHPVAVTKYLETPEGKELYAAMVAAKTRAEQGFV